jgi:hypothetical protein
VGLARAVLKMALPQAVLSLREESRVLERAERGSGLSTRRDGLQFWPDPA